MLPFGSRLPQSTLAAVRYLDGVASAEPIIDRPITIGVDASGAGGDAARLVGVDLLQPLPGVAGFDEGRPGPFAPTGSFIDPAAVLGTNGALISAAAAARLQLHRGASFAALVGAHVLSLHVANVMPARATGVDSSVVFVDFTTAQKLFHEPGTVDRIDVVTDAPPDVVRPSLLAALSERARLVVPESNGFSLRDLTAGIEATFGALASIALGVGGLLVFNAVGTSIAHRRGDIGTLRALGVAPASIVLTFVGEGAAYGALGGILGAALAQFAVQTARGTSGAHQDAGSYDVWTFAGAILLGIVVAVLSAIAPALAAARIAPALAARQGSFEGAQPDRATLVASTLAGACAFALGTALGFHPGRTAWFIFGFPLCFATGAALVIAPFAKASGTIVRRATAGAAPALRFAGITLAAIPKRISVALAALTVAVFAAVAFDVASGSFAASLHAWAEHSIAGDLLVSPSGNGGTFDPGVAARVRATPGVRSVVAIRTIHTRTGRTEVAVRGEDAAAHAPHVALTPPPAEVGARLAAALHVRTGDVVSLRTAHQDLRVRVTDVQPDFSQGGGSIVVARRVLRDAFGDDHIDALRVTVDGHANSTTVESAISRALAPLRIVTVTTSELRARFMRAFDETFAFVGALAIVVVTIASLGVGSALSALVFERRFELQTLRRLGARRSTIVRMLVGEALVVAVSGSALGLVLGVAFAALQLYAADPVAIGFAIPMTIPLVNVGAILIAGIAACIAAPLIAAPSAFRIATDDKP